MTAGYYRRGTYDQRRTQNIQLVALRLHHRQCREPARWLSVPGLQPRSDASGRSSNRIDFNSTDSDLRRRTYNGVQIGFNARVGGAQFFGGWTVDRLIDVRCDAIESNQARYAGTAVISAPINPEPDFHFCDQSQLDMPFLQEFKFAGSYTLPW